MVEVLSVTALNEGVHELESSAFPSLHHRKEGNNPPA